jgi:carboxypeptidase C (cathepsin A)
VVTQHSAKINGQTIAYTAECGWLPIRDDGKLTAKMFYIYYSKSDVQDKANRPMIFSFNGGPGTASVWMHMGYTGPRRVVYDDDGFALKPPTTLEDNSHSILDTADIVYIDPIATGFSRMVEGEDLHKYHGKLADIQSVGDFVHGFLVKKDRWASPKFVIGESYGTTRASGLAGSLLSRFNIYVNGVILVSMTGLGRRARAGHRLRHGVAPARRHCLVSQAAPGRAAEEAAQGRAGRGRGVRGRRIPGRVGEGRPARRDRARPGRRARRAYLGVSADYVRSANLRIDSRRFWKELLRDQRMTVGRLDSRYLGIDRDSAGENPEYDPAMTDWNGPFANAVNRYLRTELRYNPELTYNVWGNVRPWAQDEGTSVAEMLREAMRGNPHMKVMVQGGYYDAATDYWSAVYTISHIQPGGEYKDRFRFAWYESGHMMYLRKPDLAKSNDDLRSFIKWSLEGAKDYPRKAGHAVP